MLIQHSYVNIVFQESNNINKFEQEKTTTNMLKAEKVSSFNLLFLMCNNTEISIKLDK